MIHRPSLRGPNHPCSTPTSGRALPITERSVVPTTPATTPANRQTIKARAAIRLPLWTSHNTPTKAAGIKTLPLAEPLRS